MGRLAHNTGQLITGLPPAEVGALVALDMAMTRTLQASWLGPRTRLLIMYFLDKQKLTTRANVKAKAQAEKHGAHAPCLASWVPVVGDVCRKLGISEKVWEKTVRQELVSHGFMKAPARSTTAAGRFGWNLVIDLQQLTIPPARGDGEAVDNLPTIPPAGRDRASPPPCCTSGCDSSEHVCPRAAPSRARSTTA